MLKLLFFVVAGYLIYVQWFRPRPRISHSTEPPPIEEEEFTPYEDISDHD